MSTDNKSTVQQAAKNGNPQAIAILLNRQLQPKGIEAKVSVKDSCLQIMLEAANVLNQKALVTAIQKWIDGLGITSIQSVQIYAKQTGEEIPAWNDRFEIAKPLEKPKKANVASVALQTPQTKPKVEETANQVDSALVELAKNGDAKAIAELIKNSLQQTDIKVRATLSKGLLQVVIVSNKVPQQDNSVVAIPKLVTSFKSTLIQKVKVVGMQEIDGSANSNIFWVQESVIELPVNNHEQEEVNQKLQDALRDADEALKEHDTILDPKTSILRNLHTDLATIAIEELAKVEARLTVSVSLGDFPSIISPAVFAFNQFENSEDFAVFVPLSENVRNTCLLYQILLECARLKLGNHYIDVINVNSELGKLISFILPNETKNWFGAYNYDKVTQNLMTEASSKLVYLNELLQVIRQVSRDISASNSIARNTEDPFEKIAKLKKLKDDGILTESEFESKKKELLDRL